MAKRRNSAIPKSIAIGLIAIFASSSGCAKDQSLVPPMDSEQVTVRIKVPPELKADTMEVMYRSTLCTFTDHNAYSEPYQRDGYQKMDIPPSRRGQSDIYEARLPKNGGGECQWRLSNVTFGVSYIDPARFGKGVQYGTGGGVIVIFDENDSPRGGANTKADGDLVIKESYYPWLDEQFLVQRKKTINLAGATNSYVKHQAQSAKNIYFEPTLYSNYTVSSTGPKSMNGDPTVFIYPDGTNLANGDFEPRFEKLEGIRLAAEKKK